MNEEFIFSVVMPIYNVASFLEETLDCIVHQTIGFDKIQMILVDDGSTDESGKMCDQFKEKYPAQTVVIHKENGGQASARNEGLKYVTGKYVSMPDPDDVLDIDAFAKAAKFLDLHSETDLCCIPLKFFGLKEGDHPLNYKFEKGTRLVDLSLDENSDCILLSAASSFFRSEAIKNCHFDTVLSHAEDAKVILELLMNNPRLGLISNTVYHYRKHGNSTLDTEDRNKASYKDYLIHFSQWAFDLARERFDIIPKYVQYTVMYDLQWKINISHFPSGVLTLEEEQEYKDLLFAIISQIDDDVIISQKHISMQYKLFALSKKYRSLPDMHFSSEEQPAGNYTAGKGTLMYNNQEIISVSAMSTGWEFAEYDSGTNKITLEGYHVLYGGLESMDIKPVLIINDEIIYCDIVERKNKDLCLDEEIAVRVVFKTRLSLDLDAYIIRPALLINDIIIPRDEISTGQFFPVSHLYDKMRAYFADKICYLSSDGLHITKSPGRASRMLLECKLLSQIWRTNELGGRKAVVGRLLYHIVKPFKRKKLWIISDRIMKANDNGEALFRYLMDHKPHDTKICFAISRKSADAKRLSEIGPCIDAMSFRHKFMHLLCDMNISSQADGVTINPYAGHSGALQDILVHPRFIFLQHGIIQNDLSNWLNRFNKNISGFITAASAEYESIKNGDYYYAPAKIWLTGLPRFDRLYHNEKKIITLIPTWRRYLMAGINPKSGVWIASNNFESSQYYKFYTGILTSNRLLDALDKNGYALQFFPHPNIRLAGIQFEHDPRVKILAIESSYRDIYANSSLLITDYSSAVFDFAYLRKPLIYCQFDKDIFFSGEHTTSLGYFDYERDGFGEVEYDLESSINRIIEYVENDCALKPMYRERIDKFFAFDDKNNCKRVTEKILSLQESFEND